jgi:hypothetical protein
MKKRIPVWGRKVELLSQHDLDEIEKFREYLGDLNGKMAATDFVEKWREYMGLNELAAAAYLKPQIIKTPESPKEKE